MKLNNRLVKEVLGFEIKVKNAYYDGHYVIFKTKGKQRKLEIYKFIRHLKKWAVNNHKIKLQNYINVRGNGVCRTYRKRFYCPLRIVSADNEELAVIKAGEWVLNNISIKQPKGHFKIKDKNA